MSRHEGQISFLWLSQPSGHALCALLGVLSRFPQPWEGLGMQGLGEARTARKGTVLTFVVMLMALGDSAKGSGWVSSTRSSLSVVCRGFSLCGRSLACREGSWHCLCTDRCSAPRWDGLASLDSGLKGVLLFQSPLWGMVHWAGLFSLSTIPWLCWSSTKPCQGHGLSP